MKDEGFVAFAKESIYCYRENKLSEITLDPKHNGLFSCYFVRQINDAKDYFVIDEYGNLFNIAFDKQGAANLVPI